jgi:hypothetical protein
MRRQFVLAAISCVMVALGAAVAAAQPVVLVQPDPGDAELLDAYHRLEAELHIHNFSTRPLPGEPSAGELAELLERRQAVAAVSLLRRNGRATLELWLIDRASGEPSLRTLEAGQSDDTASLIALRAADLLRISLSELERPPPRAASQPAIAPPPPAAEPVDASAAADHDEEARLWLHASGLMLRAGGRFGVAFGPMLGVFYRPLHWLQAGMLVAAPIAGARLTTDNGSATLRQELAWLELRFVVLRAGDLQLAGLLGGGAYFVQAESQVKPPLVSRDDQTWAWLLSLGAQAEYALFPRVSLNLSLRALALLPRAGVAVYDRSALVELPALQASLGVAVGL